MSATGHDPPAEVDDDDDDLEADFEAPDRIHIDPDDLVVFVESYVLPWALPHLRAKTGLWCSRWEDHANVVQRLAELAISRDAACAGDAGGPAKWWVDIFDRHLDRIIAVGGPFRYCQAGHNEGPAATHYPDVTAWFENWFAIVLTRRDTELFWCPGWLDHIEVRAQMHSLWAAWEQARYEPVAMLGWWDKAHRTLASITASVGPFAMCKAARGHVQQWQTITGRPVTAGRDPAGRALKKPDAT